MLCFMSNCPIFPCERMFNICSVLAMRNKVYFRVRVEYGLEFLRNAISNTMTDSYT